MTPQEFFQEIEIAIQNESLLHISRVTQISETSLHRIFTEGLVVPKLTTISKLFTFLDWELCLTVPKISHQIKGHDLEDTLRKAFLCIGPLSTIQYPKLNRQAIREFINGKRTLTLYNVFNICKVLKIKVEICKPIYKNVVEPLYEFSD